MIQNSIRNFWQICKDWWAFDPSQGYVRYHVFQASDILIGCDLCGTQPLEKAVRARSQYANADDYRHIHGYGISFSDAFFDHRTNELVIYAWDYDAEDITRKGIYRESERMKRPKGLKFHPKLKAYLRKLKSNSQI